jgi:predicted DsbA family dithiol-disulfide isomerase
MDRFLTVDVWSDVACPWCYVGKRRLEAALSGFAHAAQVKVVYRAFELDPGAPAVRDPSHGYAARLSQKYGVSMAKAESMLADMTERGKQEGIAFDFARLRGGNTFNAHRLLHLAKRHGLQEELKERLFRGYFCEGKALGDASTLLELAGDVGLSVDEAQGVLSTDLYAAEVRAEEQQAKEFGIDGVPCLVIGDRYAVVGAQPAPLLQQALGQAWSEGLAQPLEPAEDEPACGTESCS